MKKTTKLSNDKKPQLEVKKERVRPLSEDQLETVDGAIWPDSRCVTCTCRC